MTTGITSRKAKLLKDRELRNKYYGYTATQYALLSSTYTYIGKFAKGFSGVMVEHLAGGRSLLEGYALFFIVSGLLGLPALILCGVLARATRRAAAS